MSARTPEQASFEARLSQEAAEGISELEYLLAEHRSSGPKPLSATERANAVSYSTPKNPQAEADLQVTRDKLKVRYDASRVLDQHRDALRRRRERKADFVNYEKAGMPQGPLTPENLREAAEIDAYFARNPEDRIRRAGEAYSRGDYDAVHRILKP